MPKSLITFLMFEGNAEAAIRLYESAFEGMEIVTLVRYGPEEGQYEGALKEGRFRLCSQEFRCYDSTIHHQFTFTPSISIFVECSDASEQDKAFSLLSNGGNVLMPPDNYGFSKRFAWVQDSYGVSWQLNLAGNA